MNTKDFPRIAEVQRAHTIDSIYLGYAIALVKNNLEEKYQFYPGSFFQDKEQIKSSFLDQKITLRSVAKPFQILTCLDLGLSLPNTQELAICLSSHSGTKSHTDLLESLLDKFSLDYRDLKCGIHPPLDQKILQSVDPRVKALQNNCAGKHLAMIKTCLINNWDYQDGKYLDFKHPLQERIKQKIKEFSGRKEEVLIERDNCQSPCYTIRVKELLELFSSLNNYQNLKEAFTQESFLISGEERVDYMISGLYPGKLIIKSGAGGLTVLTFEDQEQQSQITLLVKVFDSSNQIRALFLEKILDLYLKDFKSPKFKSKLLERESYDLSNQYKLSEIKIKS